MVAKTKIPKELPECDFISILARKASERKDTDFDFIGELERFRKRVSGEVRQINVLFPEYTPHDEQYHLKRLFHVACTVLGKERLETMNSAELFVLAAALYGHDWGMAVSDTEKEYILTGKAPAGTKAEDLCILPNEEARIAKFAREHWLEKDPDVGFSKISIDDWREYVRQSHAFRSGTRVKWFFKTIDTGVAEAASRVCEAHWLEFEDLQDYKTYPPDFSLLHESVNLRAIAVYLRLVDLLDFAHDRTPYIIWKFVGPRDPKSKMEWEKHRALEPVTCPQYQDGRIIQVDGGTDDHEVHAALEDLRIYCEDQLRGCTDILARMKDPRHGMDLYHVSWRVAARGFKAIPMQFEFDRESMFEILSGEIYQDDPYVFLRELLQNSIDAIRMRREVLKREGVDPGYLGQIHVEVDHLHRGDALVTWRDDGIGMDEYMVRNYLAVAGKSYYRSTDFEREGLEMDPISRFGVGLLSCFMVADRIEIDTFKDPYLPPHGEPLKIEIPAVNRQFRIEASAEEGVRVGTTVRVFVEGGKLPGQDGRPPNPLEVTTYLTQVAGFVEFPIVIREGERNTIVLHPGQDAQTARNRLGQEFAVHQLSIRYPWDEVLAPQDVAHARKWFVEETLQLGSDLGLAGYEGALSYLYPVKDRLDLDSTHSYQIDVIHAGGKEGPEPTIRLTKYDPKRDTKTPGLTRSSSRSSTYAVYRDGILLPTAAAPKSWAETYSGPLPEPAVVVNLPKSCAPRVDLARTQLLGQPQPWDAPLYDAHVARICNLKIEELLSVDPGERCYGLGRLISFDKVAPRSLLQHFPLDRFPFPFLEPGGRIRVLEGHEIASETVSIFPMFPPEDLSRLCHGAWFSNQEYKGLLLQWVGDPCLVWELKSSDDFPLSLGVTLAVKLSRLALQDSHVFSAVRFLVPPWGDDPPLIQAMWLPKSGEKPQPDCKVVLEKAAVNPELLGPAESSMLCKELSFSIWKFPLLVPFPEPYDKCLAYGGEIINHNHSLAQAITQFAAARRLSELGSTLPNVMIGRMQDVVQEVLVGLRCPSSLPEAIEKLCSLGGDLGLSKCRGHERVTVGDNDFVPGTSKKDWYDLGKLWDLARVPHPFGKPL